ncbi:MAG: FtsX-like permease family protein [Candidatus Odinarchaeota archaeon]
MLFVRLALNNIFRNRRSGASLTIGIFLSLLLFNALNFNITLAQDSILQSTLSRGTGTGEILASYSANQPDLSEVMKIAGEIAEEPEVSTVIPLVSKHFWDPNSPIDYSILAVQESYWNFLLDTKSVIVSQGVTNFSAYEGVSSHVPVIGLAQEPKTANETITVTDHLDKSYDLDIIGWVFFDIEDTVFQDEIYEPDLVSASNSYYFITLIPLVSAFDDVYIRLKIELIPDVVNFNDILGTINRINKLVARLGLKYPDYFFYSPLVYELLAVQLVAAAFLAITLIFVLPFFFLALYISKLASELNLESRRIQYGLYLTRGLEAKTIKRAYLAEGILLGAINGILTFFITPVAGLLLASYLPVNIPAVPIYELWLDYYSSNLFQLGWSIVIGIVLGIIIMRMPYFYLRLSPNELMHQYRQEEAETTLTRGRVDVIILLAGFYPVAVALGIYLSAVLQAPPIFAIIILMGGSYALYVAPFSPFLISYGLSSILARQKWILSRIANFYTRLVPDLRGVTNRMVFSKMYRISRIAFVMALAITFITFPLILSESLQHYSEKTANFNRGGDVRVDVGINSSLTLEALSARPEVDSAALIQISTYNLITTVNMNATEYVRSANIASFWGLNREELLSLTNSTVLVSRSIISDLGFKTGDMIGINSTNYEIKGVFKGLGGIGVTTSSNKIVIINQQLDPTRKAGSYIVRLKELNQKSVSDLYYYILDIDPDALFDAKITIFQTSEEPPSFDFILFIIKVLDAQAFLLAFVAIGALAFLMVIRVRERTREFGTWRSRGMSNTQLIQSMVIETATISTLGFGVGLFTGGGLVIGLQGFIIGSILQGTTVVPLDIIFPLGMWLLLLLMVVGTVVIAVSVGTWAVLVPISRQLRYEGL